MPPTFKILFKNFLTDKRVYQLNQNFWKKALQKSVPIDKIQSENWYTTTYANGKKIYNGNPIYSVLLKSKKSVRIIQEAVPEGEQPEISAWVQTTEDRQQNVTEELVIVLELSPQTKKIALDFIQDWVKEEVETDDMKALIDAKLETEQK